MSFLEWLGASQLVVYAVGVVYHVVIILQVNRQRGKLFFAPALWWEYPVVVAVSVLWPIMRIVGVLQGPVVASVAWLRRKRGVLP